MIIMSTSTVEMSIQPVSPLSTVSAGAAASSTATSSTTASGAAVSTAAGASCAKASSGATALSAKAAASANPPILTTRHTSRSVSPDRFIAPLPQAVLAEGIGRGAACAGKVQGG